MILATYACIFTLNVARTSMICWNFLKWLFDSSLSFLDTFFFPVFDFFFSNVLTLSFLFCSLLLSFFLLYLILLILFISPIKRPPINQHNSVTIKLITSMETVDTVKISENWKCIPLKSLLRNVILYHSGFVVKYTRSCLSRAISVILYHETITKQE